MRYAVIDRKALTELFGVSSFPQYQALHQGGLENRLESVQLETGGYGHPRMKHN
jgi:hypothetical protein